MRTVLTRAERRELLRADLIDAAERRFIANGFHATSVDAIADEAGYTKGAVYSNFRSKDELFLAVYERRMLKGLEEAEALFAAEPDVFAAGARLADLVASRRGRQDGWLAVFFEFWAYALRHPEVRERFAAEHRRFTAPFAASLARLAEQTGHEPAEDPEKLAVAVNAMVLGLTLERLTQPDVVDEGLAGRMIRIAMEGGLR
jgi:AcrR family transcriptional regulator